MGWLAAVKLFSRKGSVQVFDFSCHSVAFFSPEGFFLNSWSWWQRHKWTKSWWCSPRTETRLRALARTSSEWMSVASGRPMPPPSERPAPWLLDKPLDGFRWLCFCIFVRMMRSALPAADKCSCLPFPQTCFFIYSALCAHVMSSDSAWRQNASATAWGGQ